MRNANPTTPSTHAPVGFGCSKGFLVEFVVCVGVGFCGLVLGAGVGYLGQEGHGPRELPALLYVHPG